MIQSFIPINATPTNPVVNETSALIYIAATGLLGMVFVGLSFFFEYKFEGIVGHHYPKSLSVSFDSRAMSYIHERSFIMDKSANMDGDGNGITAEIEEIKLPMTMGHEINELMSNSNDARSEEDLYE